jgi:hypothetical protein
MPCYSRSRCHSSGHGSNTHRPPLICRFRDRKDGCFRLVRVKGISIRTLPKGSKAIEAVNTKAKKNRTRELKPFEPYVLRHIALTGAGADVFTLARIAGHISIAITQRYVHLQADAIERTFAPFGFESVAISEAETHQVGTSKERGNHTRCKFVGAKGGTRTPTPCGARS